MVEEGSEPAALKPLPLPLEEKVDGGNVADLRRCLGDIAEIDLDCGMRRVKQPERYVRYQRQYADKFEGSFNQLRELLANGKTEAAGLAHSLKGASAQLGVVGIEKETALLQTAIKNEADVGALAGMLKQSEEGCAIIWASINRLGACATL